MVEERKLSSVPNNDKKRKLCLNFNESDDEEDVDDKAKKEVEKYEAVKFLNWNLDLLEWWWRKKESFLNEIVDKNLDPPQKERLEYMVKLILSHLSFSNIYP